MSKQEDMQRLQSEARKLQADVCDTGVKLVWGEGDQQASLAIVGEAPGAQEDKQGRPFVGAAGVLLETELAMAGIPRDRVYITNVVKCRPVQAKDGTLANRTPTTSEVNVWRDMLVRELEIISPKVVLCLGAVAASALIHPRFGMNAERGRWFEGPLHTRAMATFHPAYLLRAKQYGDREKLAEFREDLSAVAEEIRDE